MSYRDPEFLERHIQSILGFYHPVCIDTERGGYINQMLDDGTVYDRDTKHLVGTCRFIFNYSVASRLFEDTEYREAAAHGLRFLQKYHRQADGGYAWVLNGVKVDDGTRHCYGHAFVLLAAAVAAGAEVEGARELVVKVYQLLEERFWESSAQLYVDEIGAGDWSDIKPYRGQNANMHMCEAMLAAWETTSDSRFLDRAYTLAERVCVDLADCSEGLIWEHYWTNWSHDWNYNREDPKNLFRPYGYLPGHFVEWTKLLLILERHRPEDWMLARACRLFDIAMERAWDHERGGMHYSFSPEGEIMDTDRYYWVLAEIIASSAVLALRTGNERYWDWYERAWAYADAHFVDHQHGAWYRVLDLTGKRHDNRKSPPSKTDYHPLSACYEVLLSLRRKD